MLVGVDALADASLLPSSGPVLTNVTVEHSDVSNNDKGFNGTETGQLQVSGRLRRRHALQRHDAVGRAATTR